MRVLNGALCPSKVPPATYVACMSARCRFTNLCMPHFVLAFDTVMHTMYASWRAALPYATGRNIPSIESMGPTADQSKLLSIMDMLIYWSIGTLAVLAGKLLQSGVPLHNGGWVGPTAFRTQLRCAQGLSHTSCQPGRTYPDNVQRLRGAHLQHGNAKRRP